MTQETPGDLPDCDAIPGVKLNPIFASLAASHKNRLADRRHVSLLTDAQSLPVTGSHAIPTDCEAPMRRSDAHLCSHRFPRLPRAPRLTDAFHIVLRSAIHLLPMPDAASMPDTEEATDYLPTRD